MHIYTATSTTTSLTTYSRLNHATYSRSKETTARNGVQMSAHSGEMIYKTIEEYKFPSSKLSFVTRDSLERIRRLAEGATVATSALNAIARMEPLEEACRMEAVLARCALEARQLARFEMSHREADGALPPC